MIRHRRSFDHAKDDLARAMTAVHCPADLLDDFARLVERPGGMGRYFPTSLLLGDRVTHELDTLLALDRDHDVAGDALTAVLIRTWHSRIRSCRRSATAAVSG
jgi:hypothetical protein